MPALLNHNQIMLEIKEYPEWCLDHSGVLFTQKEFDNFTNAVIFVNSVALLSEKLNHHPKIILDYNKLRLELFTHSAGGVTDKDIEFVKEYNKLIK